jgi:hypothetical protein
MINQHNNGDCNQFIIQATGKKIKMITFASDKDKVVKIKEYEDV